MKSRNISSKSNRYNNNNNFFPAFDLIEKKEKGKSKIKYIIDKRINQSGELIYLVKFVGEESCDNVWMHEDDMKRVEQKI